MNMHPRLEARRIGLRLVARGHEVYKTLANDAQSGEPTEADLQALDAAMVECWKQARDDASEEKKG